MDKLTAAKPSITRTTASKNSVETLDNKSSPNIIKELESTVSSTLSNLEPESLKDFKDPKKISGPIQFLETNSIVAKFGFVIFIIIIFVLLLRLGTSFLAWLFSYSTDPLLIDKKTDGDELKIIKQNPNSPDSIPILRSKDKEDGIEFTWSIWLWIKNPPLLSNPSSMPNQYKHIFNKGNDNIDSDGLAHPNNAPGLYIGKKFKQLVVVMNTFDDIKEEITIDNIPIEKWINVIIRCTQKQLDVYINGTLTKSHLLNSVPKQNYDNVNVALNGGFPGYISTFQYFAKALGTSKIQSIINRGPNTKSDSKSESKPRYLSLKWFFPN